MKDALSEAKIVTNSTTSSGLAASVLTKKASPPVFFISSITTFPLVSFISDTIILVPSLTILELLLSIYILECSKCLNVPVFILNF